MRYIKALICMTMISVLLLSCNKHEELIVISGRMVDPKQNINIQGVKVEVWAQKIEYGIYSAHYDNYGSQLSSSTGEFSFELENLTYASVKLSFSKDNYYFWEYEIDGDVIKNNLVHNETYQMQAKAWIQFIIKNENPVDIRDYFDFRIMNGITQCETCCLGETFKFNGTGVDEEFICQMVGYEDVSIMWNSCKGSVQTGNVELFFIPAFDTTRIEFIY